MTKIAKTVYIEESNRIDLVLNFFKSKQGHVAMIGMCCLVTVTLTCFLFAETMSKIKGWDFVGYALGLFFAISFEIALFFSAINSYKFSSYVCAVFSILIARATFEQMNFEGEQTFMYIASWIMSIFPAYFTLLASHELAKKIKLEQVYFQQSEQKNNGKIPFQFEDFTANTKNGTLLKK